MAFKWKKLYDVGEHLRKYSNNEEYQRSAVGRYYYACYLIARDYYENKTRDKLKKIKSHKKLINFFKYSHDEIERNIGFNLDNLRILRNKADYDQVFDAESVIDSKDYSNEILNLFKRLK